MSKDDLCEEDVTKQIELVLDQLGAWGVRRLGNYLLLDIPGAPESQAFTVIVNEICK